MEVDPRKVNLAEADIEQYLWENPHLVQLNRMPIERWIKRQFRIPSGILDLMGVTDTGGLAVVEIKNTELKLEHIAQVKRYAYDIDTVLTIHGAYERKCTPVLIGRSIADSLYRDCEACGVHVQVFDVSFTLRVRAMHWNREFVDWREQQHIKLGDDQDLADYVAMVIETRRQLEEAIQVMQQPTASPHINGDGI